jgi:hypothetical protein
MSQTLVAQGIGPAPPLLYHTGGPWIHLPADAPASAERAGCLAGVDLLELLEAGR